VGLAASRAAPRLLALTGTHVEPEADPAAPRFGSSEPRVAATPFGRLDEHHPLRRAIRQIDYPASTERVVSSVRSSPEVAEEHAHWLESVLPARATFGSEDDVVTALGTWGPPPPAATPGL
jgi:hypothetical protein